LLHLHKQKSPAKDGELIFVKMDIIQKSWNQLETWIFDSYDLLAGREVTQIA